MKHLAAAMWGIFALASLIAALIFGWRSIVQGTDDTASATLLFTILAAVSASLGTFLTIFGNRRSAEQQKRIGDDISLLAELTETSIEEARSLKPDPRIHFLVEGNTEAVDSAICIRTSLEREIDIDSILDSERELALSTMPPEEQPESWPSDLASSTARLAASIASSLAPNFELDRREFQGEVDHYMKDLRKWLLEFIQWRREITSLTRLDIQFDNRGRVPARDLVVEIRFPDPFKSWEDPPEPPSLPKRPRFKHNSWADNLGVLSPVIAASFQSPPLTLTDMDPNVSSPTYREGSVIAEFSIEKLLHGVPEVTSDPISLRAPEDGDFVVEWRVHSENLQEPAEGELELRIETHSLGGQPIETLDELLATLAPQTDSN